MIEAANLLLSIVALGAFLPAFVLFLQIGAARLSAPAEKARQRRPRIAVVVPAHNESAMIARTAASIRRQLPDGARLLVVADNCSDDTALLAARAGAEVAERNDARRIGKGYALDHGVRALARSAPPDIVVFVDADCELGDGALEMLARVSDATGRPAQARYVMRLSAQAGALDRMAQFAWRMRTFLRPLGASRLGWPSQLMGTGMAFPWAVISSADLASGHITEDLKLGVDLALAGAAPVFCPEAEVVSAFPSSEAGKRTQRTRWMHGHLATIAEYVPRLLARAVSARDWTLAAMALDLSIPPLSLFAAVLALMEALTLSWLLITGSLAPFLIASASLLIAGLAIALAWRRIGRETLALRDLLAAPAYCLARIPTLLRFFTNRQIGWIRSDRS